MKSRANHCTIPLCLVFFITPPLFIFLIAFELSDNIYGLNSPHYERQEIRDAKSDWVDMVTGETSETNDVDGPAYTDINSINYLSDGRNLNATFWLSSTSELFESNNISKIKQVYYGILIDSDFNNDTGYQGIDYQVEVKWNDTSKKWIRSFNEFSTNGHARNISNIDIDHKNFYNKNSGSIILGVDLKPMLYPDKYRLFFYSYSLSDGTYLLDAARWVYVPPPEFTISTNPEVLKLVPGEKKNIDIEVNSTTGFQPLVSLNVENHPDGINLTIADSKIPVPPYGYTTTTLTLNAEAYAPPGTRTFFIIANISFLNSTFLSPITNPITHMNPILKIDSENVMKRFPIVLTILEPIPISDIVRTWLTDWFNPLTGTWTTLTTIATGILGWRIWKRESRRKPTKNKT